MSGPAVVLIPFGRTDAQRERTRAAAQRMQESLQAAGIEADIDAREILRLGEKFAQCALAGATRVEIGPRDLATDRLVVVRGSVRKTCREADLARTIAEVSP